MLRRLGGRFALVATMPPNPVAQLKTPVVLVDAENVRRSRWPNIAPDELVDLVAGWADREGVGAIVVFDGRAPAGGSERVEVVGSRGETADDWIARAAAGYAAERAPTGS